MENNQEQIIIFPQPLSPNLSLLFYYIEIVTTEPHQIYMALSVNFAEANAQQNIYFLQIVQKGEPFIRFARQVNVNNKQLFYLRRAPQNPQFTFTFQSINCINTQTIINLMQHNEEVLYFFQPLSSFVNNIRTDIDFTTCVGAYSNAMHDYCTAIGYKAISKHKNSIVIGNQIETKNDDSIMIGDTEFKKGNLKIADDNLILYGNNTDIEIKCGVCEITMTSGLQWTYDSENDIKMKLCFQCLHDYILRDKIAQEWHKREYESELLNLKNKIAVLEDAIKSLLK